MRPEQAKGMRDAPPYEQILKEGLISRLTALFRAYGYVPLDTPAIERLEVLSAKFAGGEEILKEIFTLRDRGGRELGLRYDLTVPLARFIAQNPGLKMPFKRYQIAKVWRDGPLGAGRLREFWQCDVDVVGSRSMAADAEILSIVSEGFKCLGLGVEIRLSNRKLLNGILDYLKVENPLAAMVVIDKQDRLSEKQMLEEFKRSGVEKGKQILEFFSKIPKEWKDGLTFLKSKLGENKGISELEELYGLLKPYRVETVLNPSLARGLGYYTSTIFEAVGNQMRGSLAGGGRYDSMIGAFLGKDCPAVGVSFGLDRIVELMEKPASCITSVFVIPIGEPAPAIEVVQEFRKAGINAEIDIAGRGLSKNLDYANARGIPFVAILGSKELSSGKIRLRDMKSGREQELSLREATAKIKG